MTHSQVVLFQWLDGESCNDLQVPSYQTELAAGMDLQACISNAVVLEPDEITVVPTGFAVAIPAGYELQVRPRSGLAIKHGVTVVNAPGTIDADYRGEVKVGLVNLGKEKFVINRGDRIAQMVLAPVITAELKVVEVLPETARQAGGFGHTGR